MTLTPRDNLIKLFSVFVFGEVFQPSSIFVIEAYLPLKCSRHLRDKHSSLFWPTVNNKEKKVHNIDSRPKLFLQPRCQSHCSVSRTLTLGACNIKPYTVRFVPWCFCNGRARFKKCKQQFECQHLFLLRDIWWSKF